MIINAIGKLTPAEREACLKEGHCLHCHQTGHMARECPNFPRDRKVAASLPTEDDIVNIPEDDNKDDQSFEYIRDLFRAVLDYLITVKGLLAGRKVCILIDPGTQGNFVSKTLEDKMRIPQQLKHKPTSIGLAAGEAMTNCTRDILVSLRLGDQYLTHLPLDIIPLNFDVVLGLPWLRHTCPQLDSLKTRLPSSTKERPLYLTLPLLTRSPAVNPT
jgi:hypothetical protein